MGTCLRRSGQAHVVAALALLLVPAATTSLAADVPPAGWYAGDPHVHRSCGGPPESVSSLYDKMAVNNLAAISLLADMGNGEVQNPDDGPPARHRPGRSGLDARTASSTGTRSGTGTPPTPSTRTRPWAGTSSRSA